MIDHRLLIGSEIRPGSESRRQQEEKKSRCYWSSLYSSSHVIWIRSSLASFDFIGSSSKSSSSVIHLCRSVKRMVVGSSSGNFSYSASPMSSSVVQLSLGIDFGPL